MIEKLKFPIGKPKIPNNIDSFHLEQWIAVIEEFPNKLEELVKNSNVLIKNSTAVEI